METVILLKADKSDVHISELQSWLQENITKTVNKYGRLLSSQLVIDDDMYLHIIIVEFFV